ncbi:MAG: phosphatase PAP2 family protein [Candidatus Korobacteraceae bacterium]
MKIELRFNVTMTVILASLAALDSLLAVRTLASGCMTGRVCAAVALFFVPLYGLCRWLDLPKGRHACVLVAWTLLTKHLLSLLVQVAGRSPALLVDRRFASMDAVLHFSTGAMVRWAGLHPAIGGTLAAIYGTAAPLILACILIPPFFGNEKDSERYILSITIAAILTASLFALWPATGPWTVFGFAPTAHQVAVQKYLTLLKSGAPVRLNFRDAGVVSFPSFHVVLAVLSAIALWRLRRLRCILIALTAGICLSTLTTGWHYLIDVIGALPVIVISHVLATRLLYPASIPIAGLRISSNRLARFLPVQE